MAALRNRKMGDFLNIVYDEWDGLNPKPNFITSSGSNKFRIVTGLFNFYGIADKIRNCKLNEVYENPNENYYYIVNPIGNSYHLFTELMTVPFPENVLKCFLVCKNFNIIFLNEHEFEVKDYIRFVDFYCERKRMNPKRIYIMNNNNKLNLYKEELGSKINVYSLYFLVKFISKHLIEYDSKYVIDEKEFFFMCHNRSPKSHRYTILVLMKKYGILDDVDWSLIMGWASDKNNNKYIEFISPDEQNFYKNEINYFDNIKIRKSKYEEDTDWFTESDLSNSFDWSKVYELNTYENSYVNIVTESNYVYDEIHITEKSLKPFYFYQLPIFLASCNHIKNLKDKFGFDMFDDIIDHSYDNIKDNKKRMFAFFDEIKKLHQNKNDIINFYENNYERLEKNKQIVIDISKTEKDNNYFLNLINKPIVADDYNEDIKFKII